MADTTRAAGRRRSRGEPSYSLHVRRKASTSSGRKYSFDPMRTALSWPFSTRRSSTGREMGTTRKKSPSVRRGRSGGGATDSSLTLIDCRTRTRKSETERADFGPQNADGVFRALRGGAGSGARFGGEPSGAWHRSARWWSGGRGSRGRSGTVRPGSRACGRAASLERFAGRGAGGAPTPHAPPDCARARAAAWYRATRRPPGSRRVPRRRCPVAQDRPAARASAAAVASSPSARAASPLRAWSCQGPRRRGSARNSQGRR